MDIEGERRVVAFHQGGGYEKVFNYPLHASSIVIDLGAYEGQYCFEIFKRFQCFVFGLDAFPQKKFQDQTNVKVVSLPYGFAPGPNECEVKLYGSGDSTSAYLEGPLVNYGMLKPIQSFLEKYKIEVIDLININIEGGEYDLLDYWIKSNLVLKMKAIQIQFHPMVKDYEFRYQKIVENLSKTHQRLYCFPWVWEAWSLI